MTNPTTSLASDQPTIKFETDRIGQVTWAFHGEREALVYFPYTASVMYVLNPFKGHGTWITVENPVYSHASSVNGFKVLARRFFESVIGDET